MKITRTRHKDSRKGRVGSSASEHVKTTTAVVALVELRRLGKKPKSMSFAHDHNVRYYIEKGYENTEQRHVLMDYSDNNKQLKAKMMTRKEAWERNQILRGTGFAWAVCSK